MQENRNGGDAMNRLKATLACATGVKHLALAVGIALLWGCEAKKAPSPPPVASTPPRPSVTLHQAVRTGDIAQLEAHVHWGSDLNVKDVYGGTPLQTAAGKGQIKAVEILLANGVDINLRAGPAAGTPLHTAVDAGQTAMAEFLIAQGADVKLGSRSRLTPLHSAAAQGATDLAELLIAKGADVNALANNLWAALHSAAYYGHKDMAELLVAHGADVNARADEKYGKKTPLQFAKAREHAEIAAFLVQHGAVD